MNKLPRRILVSGAALMAVSFTASPAHADVDPSNYYDDLRSWGDFQVNGSNEGYFMQLAMIVCNMENAGIDDSDIGDYIARRESLTDRQGSRIELSASIYVCTQLHPQLLAPGH